jgi:hypothetical protein
MDTNPNCGTLLKDMNPRKLPQFGIMCPMARENNKVKCVFFEEEDSILR